MNCKMRYRKLALLLLVLSGIAALGMGVMMLWNWLMPNLFVGAKEIDYAQAMGVLLLSKVLFGGFCGHGDWRSRWRQRRFEWMTPEEREKFQAGLRGCCGAGKRDDMKE